MSREQYVEAMHAVATFMDAVAAATREHGVHLRATDDGSLAVVPNGSDQPVVPVRFEWDGSDYSPSV